MSSCSSMVRLLNLMNAFHDKTGQDAFGHDDERVLAYIYERDVLKKCVTVSDLVVSRYFGTAPTVQRRVNRLVRAGYVVFSRDQGDLRKRCLHLSEAAVQHLNALYDFVSQS